MSDFNDKAIGSFLTFDERRMLGADYLPSSVGSSGFSGVTDNSFYTISYSLPTATTLNISLYNTFTSDEAVLCFQDLTITASGAIVPSSSAGPTTWILYGPVGSSYHLDGTAIESNQRLTRFSLRNATGSTHTVIATSRFRYIINQGGESEGGAT